MYGAEAGHLYQTMMAMYLSSWVGGREGCSAAFDVSRSETAFSADLGCSSKYSNENFEDWSGESFHVKAIGHGLADPKR